MGLQMKQGCYRNKYIHAPTHGLIREQDFPSTMGGVIRVL